MKWNLPEFQPAPLGVPGAIFLMLPGHFYFFLGWSLLLSPLFSPLGVCTFLNQMEEFFIHSGQEPFFSRTTFPGPSLAVTMLSWKGPGLDVTRRNREGQPFLSLSLESGLIWGPHPHEGNAAPPRQHRGATFPEASLFPVPTVTTRLHIWIRTHFFFYKWQAARPGRISGSG